jgi:hypothetical protein
VLLTIGFFLVRTPSVQTWMAQKLASHLSKELHTKVSIDYLSIDFFTRLNLKGLYIEDQKNDTLIYAGELKINSRMFRPFKYQINLRSLELQNAYVNLKKYKGDENLNIDFLINYFATGDTATTDEAWRIRTGNFDIFNSAFSYADLNKERNAKGFDADHLRIFNLTANIDDLVIFGDSIRAEIDKLSFAEQSGFYLNELSASFLFDQKQLLLENLALITPQSILRSRIELSYDNKQDISDFVGKVNIRSSVEEAKISLRDIAYFVPDLEGIDRNVELSGDLRGTIDQIRGRNIDIKYADNTRFKGNISLTGLPEIHETFIDLVIEDFTTSKTDLNTIPIPPFAPGHTLTVPENIATLGLINFKGKFTGFLNDFVAYGNINTSIGYISSDLNLKVNEDKSSSYSGRLAAGNFDLGKYFNNEELLGKVTFDARLRGSGLTLDRIRARLDGNIASVTINNYTYTNIGVNGQFSRNEFTGQLAVNDQNIDLDFNGSIDFSGKLPVFDFTANLKRADLAGLKLVKSDTTALLSTTLLMHFSGSKIGNFEGSVIAGNTQFNNGEGIYEVKNISLISGFENGDRTLVLESDLMDARIKGNFDLEELPGSFENLIAYYIQTYPDVDSRGLSAQVFTFEAELKETSPLTDLFVSKLKIKPETIIKGNYNSAVNDFELQLSSPGVTYDKLSANEIKLNAATGAGKINAAFTANKFFTGDEVLFDNLQISSSSQSNGVRTNFYAISGDTASTKIDVTGDLTFTKISRYYLSLLPGEIIINNTPWHISADNEITIDSTYLAFRNFALSHQQQSVAVNGIVSDNPDDRAVVQFFDFDLNNFKPILSAAGIDISGIINGQAEIASAFRKFKVNADITVDNFTFTGDTLGTLIINTAFDHGSDVVEADIAIVQSTIKNIEITGKYYINRKENNLDFDVDITKLYMTIFQPYVKGVFSDIRGVLSAKLKVTGTLDNPDITGTALLQKTTFLMDYLQTRYTFTHNVVFTKEYIGFNNLVLYDIYGNQSVATGRIYHKSFKQERVDITVASNKFMILNTKALDNTLFYGVGFTTGVLNLSGTFANLILDASARTERGTQINIPLSNPEEVYSSTFIRFVVKDTAEVVPPVYVADLSGIQLNLDLEVTPDAEIQLIFDDKIGDILRGTGNADIRMGIDFLGDFKMYGNYTIESGDYLFTLQNVINKRFRLEQGGTISWNGDPYDADVNLFAIYRARASLQDLFGETDSISRRVPVNIRMHLTNKLMNPNVAFNIEVPNSDPTFESQMRNVISSDQEMNRQVFSLLVMNRFAPPTGFSTSYTAGAAANISELLSNQFSNWFSQIVPNFDFGVNYRAGDAISSEELEVLLSTELFNERIVIDGNVGVAKDQYTSNIVGDFTVEYKVSPDGRFRVKAFNRSNALNLLNDRAPYTQGIGVFYREEFDTLKDLLKRYSRKKDQPQLQLPEDFPEEDDISENP